MKWRYLREKKKTENISKIFLVTSKYYVSLHTYLAYETLAPRSTFVYLYIFNDLRTAGGSQLSAHHNQYFLVPACGRVKPNVSPSVGTAASRYHQ